MKKFSLLLCILTMSGGNLCCAAAPEVTNPASPMEMLQLVADMEKAAAPGGVKVNSLCMKTTSHIKANAITMQITLYYSEPGKLRVSTEMKGVPASFEIFDGVKGWSVTEGIGVKTKKGRELEFLRLQAKMLNPAVKMTGVFREIRLDRATSEIRGRKCRRLVCYWDSKMKFVPLEIFVDAETKLTLRSVMTAPTALGDISTTTDHLTFVTRHGVVMPDKQTSSMLGMALESHLDSFEINQKLDDKLFMPPDEDEDDEN